MKAPAPALRDTYVRERGSHRRLGGAALAGCLLVGCFLACLGVTDLEAQVEVRQGARIRVEVNGRLEGVFLEMRGDTVAMRVDGSGSGRPTRFMRSDVRRLELYAGTKSRGKAAGIGAAIGAGVGALGMLVAINEDCDDGGSGVGAAVCDSLSGPAIVVGLIGGGGLGALIGLAVGGGDRWVPASFPAGGGLGLLVGRSGTLGASWSVAF